MAQITMYPAFVNSVETTTTNSISDTDTIIYVLADTAIPNAPNLLVLGTGASAETVLMTDKTGNMLTVTRGVQGSAKAWPNGTIIARNYTAYDHDTFKANIEDNATQLAQKVNQVQFNELFVNADARNSIYRGKFLGNTYTLAQQQAVANGTFEDMYIGDYWTIGGVNYRIAAFNYYRRTGDTELTTNHITLVPDRILYSQRMNATNITTGGYTGSEMYLTGLGQARTTINAAFPSKVLTHRQILCNATVDGKASGWAWFDSSVELMNEVMVYGCSVFGDTNLGGSGGGYNIGIGKSQLPLFALNPRLINTRQSFWLRDVASAALFAFVANSGFAICTYAANAVGVRPAFSIS